MGKILLLLLGVILLALLVLLLMPVSLRVSYERGVLRAWLRYAGRDIVLYPREKQEQQEPEEKTEKEKKSDAKKSGVNREQISYSLEKLPPLILKVLRRTARGISLRPLKLYLLVASADPADTAQLYGKLHGTFNAVLPQLHRILRIKEQDIRLYPDFCEERMDCIADIGIRTSPGRLLAIVLFAAIGVLKWYLGFKKRADKPEKEPKQTTAEADSAA